jgi:poly(3-hydroxybutyrate) depolymerase
VIVLHGALDNAVSVVNLRGTTWQWVVANSLAAGVPPPSPVEVHPADHRLVGLQYSTGGTVLVESWRIEGLAHAWSGGSSTGTFTDPDAPDATSRILEFFHRHPKP